MSELKALSQWLRYLELLSSSVLLWRISASAPFTNAARCAALESLIGQCLVEVAP